MNHNLLLKTDVYKMSHMRAYAPGTTKVYSYLTARSDKKFSEVVFFGLQYYIREYLTKPITRENAEQFIEVSAAILGNVPDDVKIKIRSLAKLGYWPLQIKAVPEGTVVPVKNVLMTITNTEPEFAWCVGFVESLLLKLWYTCTVATQCLAYRKVVERAFAETVDENKHFLIPFMVHDFGYRGDTSEESAAISGIAHLLSFMGSDTVPAYLASKDYYEAVDPIMMSVPASEHSVMCSYGRENEIEAFRQMLNLYPTGIVSIVSDTFNIWDVMTKFCGELKSQILTREGTTVFRPDCYDDQTEILTQSGFKPFKDLSNDDLVAQFHYDKSITWVKPTSYYSEDYSGDMIRFNNFKNNVDLLVTPNHRMVYEHRKNGKIQVEKAEDISYHYMKKHLVAGNILGNQELSWLDRLKIAFQADGSYNSNFNISKYEEGQNLVLRFNFAKKRKVDRLLWILQNGNFEYKVSIEPSRPKNTQIYVWINTLVSKDFDWINLAQIDSNWGAQFIEETKYWDGTIRTSKRFKFDTTNYKVSKKIQEIACISGIRTKYTEFEDTRSEKFSNTYSLSIINKDSTDSQNIVKTIEKYIGKIYCVSVPSGMLVVRRKGQVAICGNSGNPIDIICGNPGAILNSPEEKGCLRLLDEQFGHTINSKGYKVLNDKVRLIYGDGMYLERYKTMLETMKFMGYAAENLVIGVGGILRNHSRDTLGFAIKATYVEVNGESRDIEKDPITDPGKKSLKGLLRLCKDDAGKYYTEQGVDKLTESADNLLTTYYYNGVVFHNDNLQNIRRRINVYVSEQNNSGN